RRPAVEAESSFFLLERENVVGGALEDAGEGERQRQTRHVAIALDGVDALARHADGVGELLLRPPALSAEVFDPVFDVWCHVKPTCHRNIAGCQGRVKSACHWPRDVAKP